MQQSAELLAVLRLLIGTHGHYQGHEYELIEVLEQGPLLVLRSCEHEQVIQADMHGEAHRLADKTYSIPLMSTVEETLHPVLKDFFSDEICMQLESVLH